MSDIEEESSIRSKVRISDDEDDAPEEQVNNEEIDDLFGDDDNEDDNNNNIQPDEQQDNFIEHDGEEEGGDGYDDQFTVSETIQPKEIKIGTQDIIRHPPKFNESNDETKIKILNAKIPQFLKFDAKRFDRNDYLRSLQNLQNNDDLELIKLLDENTIRWRFTKTANDLKIESNAQFIEWDDGSLSLKLGNEIFDVLQSDLKDTYLTSYDKNNNFHIIEGSIDKSVKFVPTSTNSTIHKKLTAALRSKQLSKPGTRAVFIDIDPEKETKNLEKLVEEKNRERRRQQLKLEKEQERVGSSHTSSITDRYNSREVISHRDEYENDGFIDDEDDEDDEDVRSDDGIDEDGESGDNDDNDDDDEDDLAAERLKRIKEDGSSKYKEDRAESSDESQAVSRKKRRVIEDDDEDEE